MRRPDLASDGGRGRPGGAARPGGTTAPAILALLALVIASIALGLTLLRTAGTDAAECRTSAWNALPGTSALPAGWSVTGSGFFADSLATTLVGPTPADGSEAPTVYVSVSCYGGDGHSALVRSRNAELASGGSDVTFPKIGTESYATRDASAGTLSVFVLRGALVANLSSSGTIDLASLELATRAIDGAMTNAQSAGSGNVTPAPPVSAPPSPSGSAGASASAGPSHVAPDLEKVLPTKAGGVDLTTESITASTALNDDASVQALTAALAKIGKKPDDLAIAQAYDSAENLDLYVYAFRIKGLPAATLTPVIVTNWLAPAGSNPKTTKVTVGGKPMTRLDFTDTGGTDYVYLKGDVVYAIETSDAALAAEAGKALP